MNRRLYYAESKSNNDSSDNGREKKCCDCNELKPYSEFPIINNKRWAIFDTISDRCKACFLHMKYNYYNPLDEKDRSKMSNKLRFEILKRDNFTCQYCGRTLDDKIKLCVDHVIPVSKGGKTIHSNLKTACYECNSGKSNILKNEIDVKYLLSKNRL